MGIDPERIDMVLKNPQSQQVQPADPLTENMNAMMNQPVKAGAYQDHDAHIAAHMPIAQQSPALQAHINEHMALTMRQQVEQLIGQPLPPIGAQLPPEIENQIAFAVAKAMQQLAPQYKPPEEKIDPLIEVEAMKVQQRAVADERDAQVELTKAEMQYRSDAEDRAAKIKIAAMKDQQSGGFYGR